MNLNLVNNQLFAILVLGSISTVAVADNKAAFQNAIAKDHRLTTAKATDYTETSPIAEAFKTLDANHNTKISRKESMKEKALAMQFDKVDSNHDGHISIAEFANYKATEMIETPKTKPTKKSIKETDKTLL